MKADASKSKRDIRSNRSHMSESNTYMHAHRCMQKLAQILFASSPISLSISKDLMHQPYDNYPDHTAVKRTYPLSQMDP